MISLIKVTLLIMLDLLKDHRGSLPRKKSLMATQNIFPLVVTSVGNLVTELNQRSMTVVNLFVFLNHYHSIF